MAQPEIARMGGGDNWQVQGPQGQQAVVAQSSKSVAAQNRKPSRVEALKRVGITQKGRQMSFLRAAVIQAFDAGDKSRALETAHGLGGGPLVGKNHDRLEAHAEAPADALDPAPALRQGCFG